MLGVARAVVTRRRALLSDPAGLSADYWWPARTANLTGDPLVSAWADEIGSLDVTTASNYPSRNTSPLRVTFDNIDLLIAASNFNTIVTSTTNWAWACVVRLNSNPSSANDIWNQPMILGEQDNEYFGLHVTGGTSPFSLTGYVYDTASRTVSTTLAVSTWAMVAWGISGGNLWLRVDKNSRLTTTCGAPGVVASRPQFGGGEYAARMDLFDVAFWDGDPGDSALDSYVDWVNSEYGLTL